MMYNLIGKFRKMGIMKEMSEQKNVMCVLEKLLK
jgi:hypothetical protein